MLRPPKRPRLHFLASVSPDPDGDLAIARARNDGLLKTRWEHIFARYEKDFEGVGDEISMLDDEIVVDNGHIKSMQNAQDTGVTRLAGHNTSSPSRYDGRRLLRAMTVAPSENSQDSISDNDADEVLQSIETIADNIITDDESSDDDLFGVQPPTNNPPYNQDSRVRKRTEEMDVKSEPDLDPLFNTRPVIRSPSVDDLFCIRSPPSRQSDHVSAEVWNRPAHASVATPETSFSSLPPKDTIDRALIREEIKKALEEENKAQEANIEPAWRIPVRLGLPRTSHSASASLLAPLEQVTQTPGHETSDEEVNAGIDGSIWTAPTRTRRSRREVAAERNLKRLRAESEDPLQDGFTSETEQPSTTPPEISKLTNSRTHSPSSRRSASIRSSSLLLRRWQKPQSADPANEDDLPVNESVVQPSTKKVKSFVDIPREVRRVSKAPSATSDTIVVRIPEVQKTMLKKRPNG